MATIRLAARFMAAAAIATAAIASFAAPAYRVSSMQSAADGGMPGGRLAVAADGSLVGTTENGGAGGHGTVYRVDTHGGITVLHAFNGTDGQLVIAGVTAGADGWFYGTTIWGAANGLGGVYRTALDGRFELVHSFDDAADHGALYPYSALTAGPDGSLYGTTVLSSGYPQHNGTLFKLTPDGKFKVIYVFGTNARNPYAGVTVGADGRLYGVTSSDGRADCGVLYSIATDGTDFRIAHRFDHLVDGCQPMATLVRDADGTLVGTAQYGGPLGAVGTIYRFDPATQAVAVLHVFHDDDPIGTVPVGGLARNAAGTFFGATTFGSTSGHGALFSMAGDGSLQMLHAFAGGTSDGDDAATAPVPTPGGGLAGTTLAGGATGDGTVYRLPHAQ